MKQLKRKTGAVNSKKKTLDGITFASSLEHYCYKKLKESGLEFGYESDKFDVLPATTYNAIYFKSAPKSKAMVNKQGKKVIGISYTPDFVSHKHKFIIETKGYVPSQHTFPLRWKLFIAHLQATGRGDYMLFLPKNQSQVDATIQTIKNVIANDR